MSHAHRRALRRLFAHPVSANIPLHEIEAALREVGAEVGPTGHGRVAVAIGGRHVTLHATERMLGKDEVVQLRHLLVAAGVKPADDASA